MKFLARLFGWWIDSTIGTSFYTWRKGRQVGEDAAGNRYYVERGGTRRWVLFNGAVDASRVPPEWHAWLHGITHTPPSEQPLARKPWEKDREPNKTGTSEAYFPPGSLAVGGHRPPATGDYEAWRP
jgi:NADH:ubiquinone oxidoreductase subunit